MEAFSLFKNFPDDNPGVIQDRWDTATTLFRKSVRTVVRAASNFLGKGVYQNMPSQITTLEEVRDIIMAASGNVMQIDVYRHQNKEYLVRMTARFAISPVFYGRCFKNPVDPNKKGIVDVNFYMGLSTEMVDLIKANSLVDSALQQWVPEEMFDANKVLPVLLNRAGVTRMSSISELDGQELKLQWFQLPGGQIFGVEVDGYSVVNADDVGAVERKPMHRLSLVKGGKK